nr:hypothetical protein Itr_chr08CG07540 [Ipomoea trifida]
MVKPRVGGAGEGKGNDDKGKGKMVSPSDTSKDIPLLLKKIEMLEAALYKALVEIEPWSRDLTSVTQKRKKKKAQNCLNRMIR